MSRPRAGQRVVVVHGVEWPQEPVNWHHWCEPIRGQTGRIIAVAADDFTVKWDDFERLSIWEYGMRTWKAFEVIDEPE